MPKYKIVAELSTTRLIEKVFEARSMAEAKKKAGREEWDSLQGWEELDQEQTNDEIRDDLCEKVEEDKEDGK